MKKNLLLLSFLFLTFTGFCQTTAPKDTTHYWTIHGQNTLLINQSSFVNWAAGGVNSVAANILFDYDFDYKKAKWSWDNKVVAGYGLSKQTGLGWRKNDDRLILNSLLGYQAAQYWLYTFYANFQTQFSDGYNYDDANHTRTLISGLFAPAIITLGPGFAYKKSDNLRVNISPVASRITLVENDLLVSNGLLTNTGPFGLKPGHKSLYEFGASLDAYYKVNLVENVSLENILKLYSNYLNKPQNVFADYTANLFMKVNKFITVNAGVELISDPNTPILFQKNGVDDYHTALQVKQIFGAGITYKF